MKEVAGNMWEQPADAYVVTTNGTLKKDGVLVMGAGTARMARNMFPGIDKAFGKAMESKGNVPIAIHSTFETEENEKVAITIISFPTKNQWWDEQSDLDLIRQSAKKLVVLADSLWLRVVVMPRPGCGNGKRDWETEIKPLIEDILDDRFIVCSGEGVRV